MNFKDTKYELQNILSGTSISSYDAIIQSVTDHLGSCKRTNPMPEEKHQDIVKEAKKLTQFAEDINLMYQGIDEAKFISISTEQKVNRKNNYYIN